MDGELRRRIWRGPRLRGGSGKGGELIEFALLLPLLLVLVVGVWDFGAAFLLKDRMTNAAREGARISVSTPLNTLNCSSQTVPCSVVAAASAVKQYMTLAGNDATCLTPDAPSAFTPPGRAVYSCKDGTMLEIDRGAFIVTPRGQIPATRVTLTYPIQWRLFGTFFSGVLPQTVTTAVTMQNMT